MLVLCVLVWKFIMCHWLDRLVGGIGYGWRLERLGRGKKVRHAWKVSLACGYGCMSSTLSLFSYLQFIFSTNLCFFYFFYFFNFTEY